MTYRFYPTINCDVFQWNGDQKGLWEELGHPFEGNSHPNARWVVKHPRLNVAELHVWPGGTLPKTAYAVAQVGDWVVTFDNGQRMVVSDEWMKAVAGPNAAEGMW